jgi:hypothetical protein
MVIIGRGGDARRATISDFVLIIALLITSIPLNFIGFNIARSSRG